MTTIHDAEVRLEFRDDTPIAVFYRDRTWQVLDAPTRLGPSDELLCSPLVTHPPTEWSGWRFIARDDHGETLTFDLRQRGRTWDVIRTYR